MGMPSCREVFLLRSSGELEHASWGLRLMASLHMALCAHCAKLARQLAAVHAALREHLSKPPKVSADLRRRVLERLRRG